MKITKERMHFLNKKQDFNILSGHKLEFKILTKAYIVIYRYRLVVIFIFTIEIMI
jgi:hypothetical protein